MKPNEYNPKAREAFAHSLIDIGVAMFKSTMLLFTAVPITLIFKNAMKEGSTQISIADAIGGMSTQTYFVFLALLSAAFIGGHLFRKEGLRHLHEIESAK